MPPWSPSTTDATTSPPGDLACYACDNEYDYLGTDAHPGRCPACGSRVVDPGGDVTLLARPVAVTEGPGESTHRVDATDATDRTFTYWIAAIDDRRAQLVRIGVDDALVGPRHDAWPDGLARLVPDWLDRAARAVDRRLVAPESLL